MSWRQMSIKQKLTCTTLLTILVALVLVAVAFLAYDLVTYRRTMYHDLQTLAQIIGTNSTAALVFNDQQGATETLAALQARQHIVRAVLYKAPGKAFAWYRRDDMPQDAPVPAPQPDGYRFASNALELFRTIRRDGEPLGAIYVQSDLQELYDRLGRYGSLGTLALLVSAGVSVLLAVQLQRVISHPILHLVQIVKVVSEKRDYTVRAVKQHEDEVGLLIEGFNEMLTQIQERDVALLASNQALTEQQDLLLQELNGAADYVMSLLPPPLHTRAIEATWKFLPSARLGGDAFGYHWLDAEHFAIYLLDVCGHGVGAALLSVAVVHALRSQTFPTTNFCDPAEVLSALNSTFPTEAHGGMFFTIWYGVYQQSTRQLVYANGGHPPPVLVTDSPGHSTQVTLLKVPGLVVGAMPEQRFTNACCELKMRSKLYVFSDGAFEVTKTDGMLLTFSEFAALLARPALAGMADLDRLFQDVQTLHGGETFEDDVSLIQIVFGPDHTSGLC